MKRFFAILVLCVLALLMAAPFLSAQSESLSQRFILVAEWGTATTVNDSIFQIDVTFPGDQLGAGYLPTQIQVGWLCLDATGRRYRITAINDAGFADADLNVLELADLDSEPTGVGIVYNPSAEDLIHTVMNGNTTISNTLMSRIFIHNMLVLDSLLATTGSGVDSFYLDGDTLRLETTTENFAVFIGGTGSGVDTFYRAGDSLYIVAGLDTFPASAIEPDSAVYATLTTLADTAAAIRADFPSVSGVTDGDYGDIDVTGSGTVWTVDTSAVTWSKLAQAVKDSIQAGGGATITRNSRGDSLLVGSTQVLDRDNPYNLVTYNAASLQHTARAIARKDTTLFQIALIGDSKTDQTGGIVPALFSEIQKHFTFSGPGYVQLNNNGMPVANNAGSPALVSANWTLKDRNTGGRGLALYSIVSTPSSTAWGFIGQITNNEYSRWTTMQVQWWGQVGGGSVEIRVDGVLVGTINTSSATGFQTTTYTGLSDIATHTVLITPLGADVELLGFVLSRTGIAGARLNRFGQTAAVVADYTTRADTALWNTQLRLIAPKLCIVNLGSNEILRDTTPEAFKAEAKKFIAQIRDALDDQVDIMWVGVTPMSPSVISASEREDYLRVVREICLEDSIAMADPGLLFGEYSATSGLFTDGVHESAVGGSVVAKSIVSGITGILNEDNFPNQYLRQFGNTTPLSTSGHTANKIPFINSAGVFTTSSGPSFVDGVSMSFVGSITGSGITGSTIRTTTAPFSNGNNLGTRASIGFFGFSTSENILNAGYTSGIRMDGTHQTVRFQATNQGSAFEAWRFEAHAGAATDKTYSNGGSLIKMMYGFASNNTSTTGTFFRAENRINQTTSFRVSIRDMYMASVRTSMVGVNHISYSNKWGDNYFNTVSGSAAIGVSEDTTTHHSTINRSAKLQVGGTSQGFLVPVVTTTQLDSIRVDGIQRIVMSTVGSGYTSVPTVTISGGGGSGATATAYRATANQVAFIEIDNPGRGYTSAPTVTISGGGGSGATATAVLYSSNGLQAYNSTIHSPMQYVNGAWTRGLFLPNLTPTTNHVPYWTGSAWATGAVSSLFTSTNIGNTDLTTSAALRVLTVGTNSSLIIRGQGLNSAIRISDGTAGEQVSLYSSNEVNVQSADTLTVSTDDGNSLVMIPNEGVTATTTNGWNLVLDDVNEQLTSNMPEVILGGVRMSSGVAEAGELVSANGLVQFNEDSPGTNVINVVAPNTFSGDHILTLPTTTGTLAVVGTYPRAEISATATRHYTLTTAATNYTVDTLSSAFLTEFTYSAGVLTYTGTATRRFLINYSLSVATDDSVLLSAGIDKNGAGPLASTRQAVSVGALLTGTVNVAGSGIVGLATSDTLKIVIQSDGAGAPIASVRFASFTLTPID